ncbi:MAG TPA: hypothetical protein VLJ18_08045 [Thermoanaerobaculia bacterium]|nr:hypothetical protein [Thermoanaerobaculia bacterium]
MLAETFLKVLERATTDLDVDRLRSDIRELAARHPEATTREKGERLVSKAARRAAFVGGIAGLPPGWAALATAAPELTALLILQSRLIVSLHLLYGAPMEPKERALEVLAGLAAGAGINVGRRLTTRAAEEVAARLLARFAGREVSHLVPLLGAAAGAALNYGAVRAVGKAALRRVERLYGPPDLPGKGLILDAAGRVS